MFKFISIALIMDLGKLLHKSKNSRYDPVPPQQNDPANTGDYTWKFGLPKGYGQQFAPPW